MSWFDIIIALILLGAFARGLRQGLTMQLAGFLAVLAGAIFAGKVAGILLPFLLKTINISASIATVVSYILAFLIITYGIKFIGKMINSLCAVLHLSFIIKILGAFLGVSSTSLVLSILINLAVIIDPEEELITNKLKTETFFYAKIQVIVPTIVPYLRKEIWEKHIPNNIKKENDEDRDSIPKTLHS